MVRFCQLGRWNSGVKGTVILSRVGIDPLKTPGWHE